MVASQTWATRPTESLQPDTAELTQYEHSFQDGRERADAHVAVGGGQQLAVTGFLNHGHDLGGVGPRGLLGGEQRGFEETQQQVAGQSGSGLCILVPSSWRINYSLTYCHHSQDDTGKQLVISNNREPKPPMRRAYAQLTKLLGMQKFTFPMPIHDMHFALDHIIVHNKSYRV